MEPFEKKSTNTDPVFIFWEEGYDSEWEFSVTIYDNLIHWHLEFDAQWAGTPKNAYQGFEDFLNGGPVSDFARDVDDFRLQEIEQAVRDKMRHPLYHPYKLPDKKMRRNAPAGTQISSQKPVVKEELPEDMKISWEICKDDQIYYVNIYSNEISIASSNFSGTNENGVSFSYRDFLSGTHQDLVQNVFGMETLKEIIAFVKKAEIYEPFCRERSLIQAQKDWLNGFPLDQSLSEKIESPKIVNGGQYCRKAGGCNTELITPDYRFFMGCSDLDHVQGVITVQRTGEQFSFSFPGYCNSVVELNGCFYIGYLNHFAALSYKGEKFFDTAEIVDLNRTQIFGSNLRISGTLKYEDLILVECWDLHGSGKHFLRFDPVQKTFISRYFRD